MGFWFAINENSTPPPGPASPGGEKWNEPICTKINLPEIRWFLNFYQPQSGPGVQFIIQRKILGGQVGPAGIPHYYRGAMSRIWIFYSEGGNIFIKLGPHHLLVSLPNSGFLSFISYNTSYLESCLIDTILLGLYRLTLYSLSLLYHTSSSSSGGASRFRSSRLRDKIFLLDTILLAGARLEIF